MIKARSAAFLESLVKHFYVKSGGIFEMDKEKALKNQGSEFREDIRDTGGGTYEPSVQ